VSDSQLEPLWFVIRGYFGQVLTQLAAAHSPIPRAIEAHFSKWSGRFFSSLISRPRCVEVSNAGEGCVHIRS